VITIKRKAGTEYWIAEHGDGDDFLVSKDLARLVKLLEQLGWA
jgi:hypothetical protein